MDIPPFITAKPRHRRKRRAVVEPSPPLGLMITSVTISIGAQIVVHFSGAIAWNGIDIPYEFKAFTQDGFFDVPIDVFAVGPDWMELEFNAGCDPGAAWELLGPMAGVTPDIAFPQAGNVI